jgi:hypothetical protein
MSRSLDRNAAAGDIARAEVPGDARSANRTEPGADALQPSVPLGPDLPLAGESVERLDSVSPGAEYMIIVRLPAIDSPEAWIEGVFRQVELEIEAPHRDQFAESLAARKAAESASTADAEDPAPSPPPAPLKSSYYVEADMRQLQRIIERMPSDNLECFPIQPNRRGALDAFPGAARFARRIEPLSPGQDPAQPNEKLSRADEVIRALGIDQVPDRPHRVLFLFQFGDAEDRDGDKR